jgi:RNA polymerase sigma factor (sigma-70 family)
MEFVAMRDDEFQALYAAEAQGLFAFLVYRTGDRVLAEDLMADAFERALRARGRFDRGKGSRKTWLYAIALNVLRDHARRASAEARAVARVGALAPEPPFEDGAIAALGDRQAVLAALAVLSDDEREAIALRFGADLSVPEVARALGEPLQRVEGRVYRALRKLRDHLEP